MPCRRDCRSRSRTHREAEDAGAWASVRTAKWSSIPTRSTIGEMKAACSGCWSILGHKSLRIARRWMGQMDRGKSAVRARRGDERRPGLSPSVRSTAAIIMKDELKEIVQHRMLPRRLSTRAVSKNILGKRCRASRDPGHIPRADASGMEWISSIPNATVKDLATITAQSGYERPHIRRTTRSATARVASAQAGSILFSSSRVCAVCAIIRDPGGSGAGILPVRWKKICSPYRSSWV